MICLNHFVANEPMHMCVWCVHKFPLSNHPSQGQHYHDYCYVISESHSIFFFLFFFRMSWQRIYCFKLLNWKWYIKKKKEKERFIGSVGGPTRRDEALRNVLSAPIHFRWIRCSKTAVPVVFRTQKPAKSPVIFYLLS